MSRLLRAMGFLAALMVMQPASAEVLRLAGDAWAPYADTSLVNGGLATDLIRTALARAGYTTEYDQVPWARGLLGLSDGRYDVLIDTWYSEERTHIGLFSKPFLINRLGFLKRKNSSISFVRLSDLYPYSVATVRGYAYSPEFDNNPNMKKVPVASFSMALRMLAAGRVQLAVEDEFAARFALSRESADVRDSIDFLTVPLSENNLHILVSFKNPRYAEIVAKFDREIEAMKADGTYERLFKLHDL
jgi:polar amino acid transport system substrate-binding protein